MRSRAGGEEGVALVIAVMSMMLMAALGSALVLTTMTESGVSSTYVSGLEAFYAADAAVERTLADLPAVDDWHTLLGLRVEQSAEALMPTATPTPQVRVVLTVEAAEVDGAIVVRAQAYGARDVERTVEAIVTRSGEAAPAGVRLLAWSELR